MTSLSAGLRAATWADHEAAATVPFMTALLDGAIPLQGYAAMLVQLRFVHRVLEEAADRMAGDPLAGPFVQPGLARVKAIEEDLTAILGVRWRSAGPTAATTAHCERLGEVGLRWPAGFVAHHYVRYLGDLMGGQAIAHAVDRTYGFGRGAGARSFRFATIPDHGAFAAGYRGLLDAAPWPPGEPERLVAEARRAYRLSSAVLASLPLPDGAPARGVTPTDAARPRAARLDPASASPSERIP